ncbi:hypothetical protein GCM10012285_24650 [Streptomyces kronopolitis]|uniref:DUF6545 domain-containing protein n=1 Tax=Streptomyces kronopolitis TaxID=1612435 RepID=A0ABQ2JBP5_9ACTN|nr:MAB_1171c family putative transporter [Streptomyces kronopolitis]GGN43321.1 hypothetical protein GCM10012285_24650 [Streptomyces kronopolitis]
MFTAAIWVNTMGIVSLWLASVFRARAAVRGTGAQRALWVAVTLIALTTLVHQPAVTGTLSGWTGDIGIVNLATQLLDVTASTLMLYFVVKSVGGMRHSARALAAGAVLAVALCTANFALAPEGAIATPEVDLPFSYALALLGFHLVADAIVAAVCFRQAARASSRQLRWAFSSFALGTALTCVSWVLYLLYAATHVPYLQGPGKALTGIEEMLQAFGVALPGLIVLRRRLSARRALWRLWPLWQDLTEVTPHVRLTPQQGRFRGVTATGIALDVALQRVVVEIRDAILELSAYADVNDANWAAPHTAASIEDTAAVTACWLPRAKAARLSGRSPSVQAQRDSLPGGMNLDGEIAFLLRLRDALAAPPTRAAATAPPDQPARDASIPTR